MSSNQQEGQMVQEFLAKFIVPQFYSQSHFYEMDHWDDEKVENFKNFLAKQICNDDPFREIMLDYINTFEEEDTHKCANCNNFVIDEEDTICYECFGWKRCEKCGEDFIDPDDECGRCEPEEDIEEEEEDEICEDCNETINGETFGYCVGCISVNVCEACYNQWKADQDEEEENEGIICVECKTSINILEDGYNYDDDSGFYECENCCDEESCSRKAGHWKCFTCNKECLMRKMYLKNEGFYCSIECSK